MSQKGFSVFLMLIILVIIGGGGFGSYTIYQKLSAPFVDTSGWKVFEGKYVSFKYPPSWDTKTDPNVSRLNPGKELIGLGIPNTRNVGGFVYYYLGNLPANSYCQSVNKSLAYKYQSIAGKRNGNKCVFTEMKSNVDEFKGYAYLYNFKSDRSDGTVSIDVKLSSEDLVLEEQLDAVVSSLKFKDPQK